MMLTISSLNAAYEQKRVVKDLTLEACAGEITALIGPNGAGKTTVIRAVSGTIPILSGEVLINGENLAGYSNAERARAMAVVPQARQMGGAYTVAQAVMMGRTAHMSWLGHESDADQAAVQQALKQTNLESFTERQIAKLSGGEQQRVLLARALAQATPVLLLDEPTNHLDLKHQMSLLMLVKKLAREKGLAVLMAMHDLNLVSSFADKTALMVDGELKAVGSPEAVLTAELISSAYEMEVDILKHPATGAPVIIGKSSGVDKS